MRKRVLHLLSFAAVAGFLAVLGNTHVAGGAEQGGTIKGKVTYAGGVPAPQKLEVTKDTDVCGQIEHHKDDLVVSARGKGLANVVIRVNGVEGGKSIDALGADFTLDQKGCAFTPRVAVVPVGAKLQVKNSDGILHNIHTHSEANRPINKAQPAVLKTLNISFRRPEIISVSCDLHEWMHAIIVVMEHPYYAVTDLNGEFTLTDVPAGKYTVEYWHETLGKQVAEVSVTPGQTTEVTFEYQAAP